MTNGLGWAGGNLWIVEESRFCLTRIAEYSPRLSGEVGKDWSQLKRFYPGQGLPGQVWSSGKVQWITDLTLTDMYPRAGEAAQVGLHTVCGSPFLLDGKVSGVFECFHQDVLKNLFTACSCNTQGSLNIACDQNGVCACANTGEIVQNGACACANTGEKVQYGACSCPVNQLVQNGACASMFH